MNKFGVGLVAYNMSDFEIEQLSASLNYTSPAYKVVVDNSRLPKSKEVFEKHGWIYIHKQENPGFGASHNFIFKEFSKFSDYHLIINPDIVFKGDVLSPLVKFLDDNDGVGCVIPKVYFPDGSIQKLAKPLPGPLDLIINRISLLGIRQKFEKNVEGKFLDNQFGSFKSPFVSGCFLLFRTSVIQSIGFFDERFFMYMEDVDLSRRLWINKTPAFYFGAVSVIHKYQKGSSKSLRLFLIHICSAIKFFNKWGWYDKQRILINKEYFKQ